MNAEVNSVSRSAVQRDPQARPEDVAAIVARVGALPQAPLAMPKQRLEHEAGLLRRLLRLSHAGSARTQG